MTDLNFDLIFRHLLDNRIAGRSADGLGRLELLWVREKIEREMLNLIMQQGLTEVLLCRLELYELNRALRGGHSVGPAN